LKRRSPSWPWAKHWISFLDAKGRPGETERVFVIPPGSQFGPHHAAQRAALLQNSLVAGAYEKTEDRESAYEKLTARTEAAQAEVAKKTENSGGLLGGLSSVLFGSTGPRGGQRDGLMQQVLKSEARNLARQVLRGALGSILGGKKR
jgi:hypothetical protein